MREQNTGGSIWTSWVIPLIIVGGLVAVFGLGIASTLEISYAQGCAVAVPAVLAVGGYFFAEQWVYAVACRRLGYQCEMRPQPKPHSAQYDADLVITGTLRGHRFALYRDRHNNLSTPASTKTPSSGPLIVSVVEWSDPEFKAAPFELHVGPAAAVMPNPFGITSAVESAVSAVRAASGHPEVARPGEPVGFPQSARDQLDTILGRGIIDGEPGYLAIRETPRSPVWTRREGKFPYPWEIAKHLDRADQIRHVCAAEMLQVAR